MVNAIFPSRYFQIYLHLRRLFAENCDMFSMEDSNFVVSKQKESSARQVMWKEF